MLAPMRFGTLLGAALAAVLLPSASALSHPHVWVRSKAVIVYDTGGRVTTVRHSWEFDEAYSAYAVQGFEKGADGKLAPDKMAELAKLNVESLAENGYFTLAKANGAKLGFEPPQNYGTTFDKGALTLSFELPLKSSSKGDRTFTLEVFDPSFFVDFAIADGEDAIRLDGAPSGCALKVTRPRPPDAAPPRQSVTESFLSALNAAGSGPQLASRVLVACP